MSVVITRDEVHRELERVWRECRQEYEKKRHRVRYWGDPQKERDRKTKYRRENPEKIIAQRAKFYQLHKERVKAKVRAYKAKKRAEKMAAIRPDTGEMSVR